MRSVSRFTFCRSVIFLAPVCCAQQLSVLTTVPANPITAPAANIVGNSGSDHSAQYSYWPLPYLYGGLALSRGAGFSPAAGTIGGGLDMDSSRFILFVETSAQNAHKHDSGTGAELDLKGHAFFRAAGGWYFGGGAQWSKLSTVLYDKQAWHPTFGGGKDLFREKFSMRAQVLYISPGSDHLNALQGPEISLWMPSPASRSHLFYRQTLGIYEFHQTSVQGNSGLTQRCVASFLQFTAMYRF